MTNELSGASRTSLHQTKNDVWFMNTYQKGVLYRPETPPPSGNERMCKDHNPGSITIEQSQSLILEYVPRSRTRNVDSDLVRKINVQKEKWIRLRKLCL